MRRLAVAVCLITSIVFADVASGWGPNGHEAAKKVRKILGSTLRTASVWADCAKGTIRTSDGTFKYVINPRYTECRIYENPASIRVMVDFVRRNWDACNRFSGDEPCHKQYHYTDVGLQRDAYASGLVGTSDHDIVAAINATIAVLQGGTAPAPFSIKSKREALRLLAHYMGDIHQPLHVVSIYLDADGHVVDPDSGAFDPASK